jgi:hypothetical protein
MKTAYFVPISEGASLTYDTAGWPTGDCSLIVFDKRVNMPWNGPDAKAIPEDVHGTYVFSCTGKCVIEPSPEDQSTLAIQNLSYDPKSNVTKANLVLAPGQNLLIVNLKNTAAGVKNIRIIRPGYPANTKQIFTTAYLRALKPFAIIRFMDFLSTNNYPTWVGKETTNYDWSERRLPSDATQTDVGDKHGVALEYAAELANEENQDLWVNVPDNANDDYVRHMAALLHKLVKPNLRIYVEYSNEVWNWGFGQSIWAEARAEAEVKAGHSNLNSDGSTQNYVWQSHFYARRTFEISKIFQSEFGPNCLGTRIRPVLDWQTYTSDNVRTVLTWAKTNIGEPKQYIWGLGDAPYYNPTDTSSVDAIFATQKIDADSYKADTIAFATLAHDFGLHRVAYEGGSGISGVDDLANKLAASRDPRMTESVRHFLIDDYFSQGGEVLCYYCLNCCYSKYGAFGLLERDFTNLDAPKYKGAMQTIADLKGK